jgi:hypothetical protein
MTEQEMIQAIQNAFKESNFIPKYEDLSHYEEMLAMRDDIKLRTIVVRPTDLAVTPCVFTRSCYPFLEPFYLETARQYASRGIAYVVQYCRGIGGSQGEWEPNVHERADGKDMADWLCSQDWVGNTGYWGSSYLAMTGWIIADIVPAKVKTMYLTLYGTDRHVSAYQDGMFRHDVLTAWAMGNAGFPVEADYIESCLYRPHVKVDEALWGRPLEWYRQWVTNTGRTDAYWQSGLWKTLQDIPSKITIPISISEGWYDHHLGSAIESYKQLSEVSRAKSEFIIGPWNHFFEAPLEDDNGKDYACNDTLRALEWFRRILIDEEIPKGRVAQYVIKGDYWTERESLNPQGQEQVKLYLSEGGLVLDSERIRPGQRSYTYDPKNPIYSHGGESLLRSKDKIGSLLQQPPDYRPDVLSFISEALDDDISCCGPILACLYVSSDAEDTAFSVRVMQVNENGKSYFVRSGITTLAYRGNADKPVAYIPGDIVEITVDMWDIAWEFKKGSRIRIDIQSSDFPQYSIHTNTPGIWSAQEETRLAEQSIYFNAERPSHISLPVFKKEQL